MSGRVLPCPTPLSVPHSVGLETARLVIDLTAIRDNYHTLRRLAPHAEIGAVVKANAYGLGLDPCAQTLWEAGARAFFTARLNGAIALRALLGQREAKIYVLDGLALQPLSIFRTHDLIPVLSSRDEISAYLNQGGLGPLGPLGDKGHGIALHVDTGMNRLGLSMDEALLLAPEVRDQVTLLVSHLSSADEPDHPQNPIQKARFEGLHSAFPRTKLSLTNSSGLFLDPTYVHDLARPGISLFGGGPTGEAHPDLKPVARLYAKVFQRHRILPGDTVGYGAAYETSTPKELATLGMGYADGLFRSFWPNGYVVYHDKVLPLAGKVSMDLFTLDVSQAPQIKPGDWLELFGDGLSLDAFAGLCGTISYEILTGLGTRVLRTYETPTDHCL